MLVRRARVTRKNGRTCGVAPTIVATGDARMARNAERKDSGVLSIGRPLVGMVCAAVLCLSSCGGHQGKEPPLVVILKCDPHSDIAEGRPWLAVTGELMTHTSGEPYVPTVVRSSERRIGALVYRGFAVYDGPGAWEGEGKSLVMDIVVRRMPDLPSTIDIYLSCKVQCRLDCQNFKGGILRDLGAGEEVEGPYLFDPGQYHLHALAEVPEGPEVRDNDKAWREEWVIAWLRTKIPLAWAEHYRRGYGLSPYGERSRDEWVEEGRSIEGAEAVLIELLQEKNPRVDSADVVDALVSLGTSESVPVLSEALESKDWWTSVGAAQALGNIGDKRAVEPLCRAALARDRDVNLRANAAVSLGKIGDPKALPTLVSVLKDDEDDFARQLAAEALGKLGDKAAVDPLSHALLHDENAHVRTRAVTALGVIGDARARDVLQAALEDEDASVEKEAAQALQKLEENR